ncbi:hypothetical protein [Levilactobacillus mulengensis]|uniref:hypothetical protein n=1 Tax=Levilactobacillus mulengensis TaxID=2486025 RepID=UPI0013DE42B8|nr:hypothetical protein [Levilactobacillus mulengensis]
MMRKRQHFIGGLLVVIAFVLGGAWQFQRLNRGVTTKPVVEQIVQPHQWSGSRKAQFKMLAATQRTVTDGKEVTLHLFMQSIKPANYGFHANNLNMIENMWLNIPYSISNQSRGMQHPDGRYYTEREWQQPTIKDVTLRFLVIPNSYRQRQQSARFSFLVPERSDQFVKYSVLLNLGHDGSVLA